jgi:hypothetical protein
MAKAQENSWKDGQDRDEADPRAAHCHHTGVLAPAIPDKPMAKASVNGSTRTTKWSPHPGHQPKERTHGRRIEIEFVRKAGKDSARGQPSGALTPAMEKAKHGRGHPKTTAKN